MSNKLSFPHVLLGLVIEPNPVELEVVAELVIDIAFVVEVVVELGVVDKFVVDVVVVEVEGIVKVNLVVVELPIFSEQAMKLSPSHEQLL